MREIKFRGWDEERKTMCYQDKGKWMLSWRKEGHNEFELHGSQSVNNFFLPEMGALMQCTGLKDKNGVDVYEGDILGWGLDPITKVGWSSYDAQFELVDIRGGESRQMIKDEVEEDFEIIGNIHENSEILK